MKFKKGDRVVITNNGRNPSYDDVVDCFGTIRFVREYKIHKYNEITYYVSIPNKRNMKQSDGWWCCDEDMLAPYRPECMYKTSIIAVDDPIYTNNKQPDSDLTDAISLVFERFNNKGEENKMEILDIYRTRKLEKLAKSRNNEDIIIKKYDKGYKYLTELGDDLLKNFDKNVKNCVTISLCNYNFNDTILKLLEENHEKYLAELDKLNSLCDEIKAQLDMCETYGQKQDILERYEILKDGKINA